MIPRKKRLSRIRRRPNAVMYLKIKWWPTQKTPMTAKLMANPMIEEMSSRSTCPASASTPSAGTRRSTTSSVIAIANTAALQNSTRSYSRPPLLASG
jgi:hypothetical protein